MYNSKEQYKNKIKELVSDYHSGDFSKRSDYEKEVVEVVKSFIMLTNAMDDKSSNEYIINAMGIMSENNKCDVACYIIDKIGADKDRGGNPAYLCDMAMATLYINSCMDITKMSPEHLNGLKLTPMGRAYVDYSTDLIELTAYQQEKMVDNVCCEGLSAFYPK